MKRKPRKKFSEKGNLDMMKPIPIDKIGTVDDPCFGQYNDPNAEECNRCGDCELCAIAQAQKLHIKRAAIEKGQAFKDIVPLTISWKALLKSIRGRLKPGPLSLPNLKDKVCKRLNIHESDFDKHYKILQTKNAFKNRVIIHKGLLKLK